MMLAAIIRCLVDMNGGKGNRASVQRTASREDTGAEQVSNAKPKQHHGKQAVDTRRAEVVHGANVLFGSGR